MKLIMSINSGYPGCIPGRSALAGGGCSQKNAWPRIFKRHLLLSTARLRSQLASLLICLFQGIVLQVSLKRPASVLFSKLDELNT